ncbi:MAG: amidohydrolase family protein, partial [Flammeovirgaceae bacterium]|nr:amidohydrolase family protein [Flammeovirgaceae bacterium]MDW8288820.1 adenine deaminase C-terminal domain-containing protein [Flammeovirgaceae bacterium]
DPHEIGNVLGIEGVGYMLEDGKSVPFKFYFGAPSCVPATSYETAGAVLSAKEVEELLNMPSIKYLSEMMNYPGVLYGDEEVHRKMAIAKKYQKPIDGHAPGLRGEKAKQYIEAGISTDHECFTLEEALEKLSYGMKVIIREGSAAKNFEALHPLIASHPQHVMFCSDDKHPDDLLLGHINLLVKRALQKGYDLFDVLRIACVNPVEHYHLEVGLLHEGDAADFILVDDLKNFNVLKTYIDGQLVAEKGRPLIQTVPPKKVPNLFNLSPKQPEEFAVRTSREKEEVHVIVAVDGEIVTQRTTCWLTAVNGNLVSDVKNDVLKIAVVNRYEPQATIGIGFIKGFGLKAGAIAASVAHDSHNLIAIGTSDELLCEVINVLINQQGGIAVHTGEEIVSMPLP